MKKSADAEYDFLDFWEANQKFFAMKQGTTKNLMHFKERFLRQAEVLQDLYGDAWFRNFAVKTKLYAAMMDIFIDALVDQEELLWLNWCRKCIQVTTLSELTTADATTGPKPDALAPLIGTYGDASSPKPFSAPTAAVADCCSPSDRDLIRWTDGPGASLAPLQSSSIGRPPTCQSTNPSTRVLIRPSAGIFTHTWTGPLSGDVQRASVNLHPRTSYVTVKGISQPSPTDILRNCHGHSTGRSTRSGVLAGLDPSHLEGIAADMDDDWGWVPEYLYIEGDIFRKNKYKNNTHIRVLKTSLSVLRLHDFSVAKRNSLLLFASKLTMGKSKNNKKVAIAAKAVNSTALTQGRISFLQKSRVETAKIRSKKESDDLDPPIHNNNSDINMEEVEHPLKYDRIVPNIDSSQWNLQTLAYLCTIHRACGQRNNKKEVVFGNELFLAWENEPDFHWPWCEGYLENFVDPPATESWEAAAEKLLQICDGDWNLVEQRIRAALDQDIKDEFIGNDRELVVYVRGLILGLAVQDPLVIFPLDEQLEDTTFTTEVEPRLLLELRPLAKVWAIAVELLGHPWTDPETTTVVTELSERRSAAKGRKRERDLDPSTARKLAPIDPRSPARGFFLEATPQPVRDSIAPDKEDAVMVDTTGPSVISPTNKPVNGEFAYWSDNDGSESGESAPDFSAPSNSDHPPTEVVVGNSPAPAQRANDPSATVLVDSHLSEPSPPKPSQLPAPPYNN
ncbi:unnamed protein product [Cylindrotheca closterium]|uniref:Uncharacterized protein n=1 Tax=Cylindrotheca closterium TaxID=2856 RepID=A0AAD2JNW9_9STRA|nr:unnamed protein product [Cylindrotheca closterium]